MSSEPQIAGVDLLGLVYLALVIAAIFLPMLLGGDDPPGDSDSDSDNGGGNEPWRPPPPSNTPGGGIPLDDAAPARARLRGHDRLVDLLPAQGRRWAREPHRRRVRTPG